jgi:FAD/FMN-containing dehydrogenase
MTEFYPTTDYTPWGLIPRVEQSVARPRFRDELPRLLIHDVGPVLCVGLRRSYGDSCVNAKGRLIDMTGVGRFVSVDWETGILKCDAGVSLDALLHCIVPRGWFTATTPGTRFVTIGGAIANDVHGKNHHARGSFGCSVRCMTLLRTDGSTHVVRPNDALFRATVGGLGLTGLILEAEVQLTPIKSAYLDCERLPFEDIAEFFALAEDSEAGFEHTVAWIDCSRIGDKIGGGIFQRANWVSDRDLAPHDRDKSVSLPFSPPIGPVNRHTVRAFNRLYDWAQRRGDPRSRVHYSSFFYPLDAVLHWNRLYGKRGFYQYQCVIPPETQVDAVRDMLKIILASGEGSILSVLKTLGPKASGGLISFPREGATLALDFVNRGATTLKLMSDLDEVVSAAGGRLYPAKDGRMPAQIFQSGYPNWRAFAELKDPGMRSDFWERVSHGN